MLCFIRWPSFLRNVLRIYVRTSRFILQSGFSTAAAMACHKTHKEKLLQGKSTLTSNLYLSDVSCRDALYIGLIHSMVTLILVCRDEFWRFVLCRIKSGPDLHQRGGGRGEREAASRSIRRVCMRKCCDASVANLHNIFKIKYGRPVETVRTFSNYALILLNSFFFWRVASSLN